MNAMSGEGFSVFTIEVEPDYDLDEVYTEVNAKTKEIIEEILQMLKI